VVIGSDEVGKVLISIVMVLERKRPCIQASPLDPIATLRSQTCFGRIELEQEAVLSNQVRIVDLSARFFG
jgi:hypothetical protein